MNDEENLKQEKKGKRLVVKGELKPDGTSYYVSIPKEIRDSLGLKGGEYFVIKAKPDKNRTTLKLIEITE
jgi:AbrB family looped-hinge helix DNA binding protein